MGTVESCRCTKLFVVSELRTSRSNQAKDCDFHCERVQRLYVSGALVGLLYLLKVLFVVCCLRFVEKSNDVVSFLGWVAESATAHAREELSPKFQ